MKKLWKWLVGIFTFIVGILVLSGKKNKRVKEIKKDIKDNQKKTKAIDKQIAGVKETDEYLKKTLEIQPNNSAALNNLGNILKEMGKFDEAIKSYEKATKIQINHPNAYHNLGNTYKQLGNFEKASDYYFESMKFNPKNLETLFSVKI